MSYINFPFPGHINTPPYKPDTSEAYILPKDFESHRGTATLADLISPPQLKSRTDGGPSDYYDFPASWTTFNDFIEYKSEAQWGKFSFHLGNIGKALCRWGDKDGTSIEYDAKKIIYSSVRTLKMIIGTTKTREYLQRLLDDPQFKD
jgi:hypothetical protein